MSEGFVLSFLTTAWGLTFVSAFVQLESANTEREFTYQGKPPNCEWHLARKLEDFELMTVSFFCYSVLVEQDFFGTSDCF